VKIQESYFGPGHLGEVSEYDFCELWSGTVEIDVEVKLDED